VQRQISDTWLSLPKIKKTQCPPPLPPPTPTHTSPPLAGSASCSRLCVMLPSCWRRVSVHLTHWPRHPHCRPSSRQRSRSTTQVCVGGHRLFGGGGVNLNSFDCCMSQLRLFQLSAENHPHPRRSALSLAIDRGRDRGRDRGEGVRAPHCLRLEGERALRVCEGPCASPSLGQHRCST
jgi:hypothetical protein